MRHLSGAPWHGRIHRRVLSRAGWTIEQFFSEDAPRCRKPSAAGEAAPSSCPGPAERRGSLLALAPAALQPATLGGAGANPGAPLGDGAGGYRHLLLIIADAAWAAVGHGAAHGLAGGGQAGAQRDAGDVPTGLAGAQLAGKVDVEGAAGGDVAAGEALHLTVGLQVRGAGTGWGARGAAAPSRGGGRPLRVPLGAREAGAGVARGFRGRAAEQEAGERQAEGASESHAAGERKGDTGTGVTPVMGTANPQDLDPSPRGVKRAGCGRLSLTCPLAIVLVICSLLGPGLFALKHSVLCPKAHPSFMEVSSTP